MTVPDIARSLSPLEADLPVITLWQPWASLIFSGHKLYETRSFRPPEKHRGKTVAIHAAAKMPAMGVISEYLAELCYDAFGCGWNYSLPLGAILGTVKIGDVVSTNDEGMCAAIRKTHPDSYIAGDWSPNRFGWWLYDVQPLTTPVPWKGKQGWGRVRAALLSNHDGGE